MEVVYNDNDDDYHVITVLVSCIACSRISTRFLSRKGTSKQIKLGLFLHLCYVTIC